MDDVQQMDFGEVAAEKNELQAAEPTAVDENFTDTINGNEEKSTLSADEIKEKAPVILLLSGLPGCGKTTFAQQLCSHFSTIGRKCFHLEYDKILDHNVDYVQADASQTWKVARRQAYEHAREILCDALGRNQYTANGSGFVLIVDDNFYYASMRYEYVQLSRSLQTGFAIVHFDVPVDICIQRSRLRLSSNATYDDFVSEKSILMMSSKLEVPSTNRSWERFCIVDSQPNIMAVLQLIDLAAQNNYSVVEKILGLSNSNITSLIHQSDLILRRLVAESMACLTATNVLQCSRSDLAGQLNQKKRNLLEQLKNGQLDQDISMELLNDVNNAVSCPTNVWWSFWRNQWASPPHCCSAGPSNDQS